VTFEVRPIEAADRDWILELLHERWAGEPMVIRGVSVFPSTHPGFVATDGDERVGLITYTIDGGICEITSLDSLREGRGIGSALLDATTDTARASGCVQLRLVTTNDNEHAIGWYGRRGFVVADVRRDAMDEVRRLKPAVPLANEAGIPIRDEISMSREP
jgi:ribosomal protein S18 acetylase RimI-like enzyme